jgi:hypothetical protein
MSGLEPDLPRDPFGDEGSFMRSGRLIWRALEDLDFEETVAAIRALSEDDLFAALLVRALFDLADRLAEEES